ncbi:PAS domain-containing protein [Marinifilum sp. N1E240]|uniref:hybrid sensor histidine kinase/response regulator n=1 Tax=Marinifilum sp. N1E240 TaxID=2608082 RepID=UPI00128D10A7|nr:PAS domain S-box protein [Marinifilum sp. N1E240]MPQ47540.1 PAS domain-containing protein [Marinifilum sp. N1E240]
MTKHSAKETASLLNEIKNLKSEISELKKSKNQYNVEGFSYIFKTAKLVSLEWLFKPNKLIWSDNAEEILGFKPDSFSNTKEKFIQKIHPEDTSHFLKKLEESLHNCLRDCQSEFRMILDNGEIIWINATSQITYDKDNNPDRLLAILLNISTHKKTEEKLRERTERYELITKGASDGIWDWNIQNKKIYFSPRWKALRGYAEHEISDDEKEWSNGIHPDDIKRVFAALQDHFDGKTDIFEEDYRVLCKNGSYKWITDRGVLQRDTKGNITRMAGSETDITKKKKFEKEHVLNQLRYHSMFNDSPVPLWEEDFGELFEYLTSLKEKGVKDFRKYFDNNPNSLLLCSQKVKVTDVNKATLELHKAKSKEELLGNLDKIFTSKSFEVFKEEVIAIANGESEFTIEGEIKTLEGDPRTILLKLFINKAHNNTTKAILATIDITEKKIAEEALIESENKFRLSFEASAVGMVIVDKNKKFIAVNQTFCKIIESTENELLQKSFMDITHPNDIIISRRQFKKGIDSKTPFTLEKRYITSKGNTRWGLTTVSPIFDNKNQLLYVIAHIQDITESKEIEQKLIESKNNYEALAEEYKNQNEELLDAIEIAEKSDKLKSEFLQNLSHEIRTPMNAIIGFSDFLDLNSITPDKRKQYINIIKSSGNQLLRIIDDILEISALETNHVQLINTEFNLNSLLTELFTIFQPQAKKQNLALYLHKGLHDDDSIIVSDESKLRKITSNLIENSLKFTKEGSIEIGYHRNEKDIELYVKDTGIGISINRHDKIFERFSQAEGEISKKTGGLGLGLSIVRENVKLLGGTIKLSSNPGEGSKFSINIPDCIVSVNSSYSSITNEKKEYNILIAEDEELNYFYFESLMEEIAPYCNLIHAKNGLEAIELCINNDFDLVLMDIKMPEMNGYEATVEIKKHKPHLNVIAQTAYSTAEDKAKAKLAGCVDFLSKPISMVTVQKILDKFLD